MKFKAILLIILLIPVFLPKVSAQTLISVIALNKEFIGLPGDTIVIPFNLTNHGNETITNLTVYVTGPAEGLLYQSKVIRQPLLPGQSIKDTLLVKILNIEPGKYSLQVIARVGDVYAQDTIELRVKTVIDYDLKIYGMDRYIYGEEIRFIFKIISKSNGILTGRVGYSITGKNGTIENVTTVTYVLPGGKWETILAPHLGLGRYTAVFWANFSGVYKKKEFQFVVYQRNLSYRAYYQNGVIHVVVTEDRKGVPGIEVQINGQTFKTNDDGLIEYLITQPGEYLISLNLDGRIENTIVVVKALQLTSFQNGSLLVVRVIDSNNTPVGNVLVTATGQDGKDYAITREDGIAFINLNRTGYGTVLLRVESDRYIGVQATAMTVPPKIPTKTQTTTTTPPATTTTTPVKPPKNHGPLVAILLIAGVLLAGTSYAAFFRPIIQEEMLDRYYFVKVRAPKLRGMEGFRFEKGVNAIEVKATKGRAEIKDGLIVWEIEHLEPEEEAYLQVILG